MNRDDREHDQVMDPDATETAGERARADNFARLVDKLIEGAPPPPAMDSDDRALIEVAVSGYSKRILYSADINALADSTR